jgi:hypothetical protein
MVKQNSKGEISFDLDLMDRYISLIKTKKTITQSNLSVSNYGSGITKQSKTKK